MVLMLQNFFLHILKVILKVVVTTLYFLHKDFFQNAPICKQFKEFICSELYERIPTESFSVVGKVGECELSLIIMPLTVEPTKPRLCHDDSNINLWTKDTPFQLENLKHVPRMIEKDMKMITCDENSGYDHVILCKHLKKNTLEYSLEVGFSHTTHCHLTGNHPLTFIKP